jgi:hypothetical protein
VASRRANNVVNTMHGASPEKIRLFSPPGWPGGSLSPLAVCERCAWVCGDVCRASNALFVHAYISRTAAAVAAAI